MNILLISHFFPPHKGGIETTTYNIAKKLTEKGHEVIVITSKVFKAQNSYEKVEGFHIYRYKSFNLVELRGFPQSSSLGFPLKAIIKLKKIIRTHEIQIIHLWGRFFPISFISAFLNILIFKKKMYVSIQGRLKFGLTGLIENFFDTIVTYFIYSKLSKVMCVSTSLKRRLINYRVPLEALITIPNGVDIDKFKKKKSSYLNNFLEEEKDNKKVIFVGRLDLQKGVEYLIRSIPDVITNFPKVSFFILGNGRLENYLKKLAKSLSIENHVRFLNMIPIDEMPNFYSAADIFCLPSIHEGFPLSIVEALSIGLIVVASKTGGIPEVIIENENGYLFEPKNIRELSLKLLKALNLPHRKKVQIQENNVKKARNIYSWEKIVTDIIKIYQDRHSIKSS